MDMLDNPIRNYAWGSTTSIAAMQGRPVPTAEPEAELWMGAHPDSPSRIRRAGATIPVGDAVAADPVGLLGAAVAERFGPRLPFMLKVLAAEFSLSLQAHPDAETAARRYADENAAGIGHGAAERRYADPYAKPEMLVALDEFDTLCGFRDPAESAAVLASLNVPALAPVIAALRDGSAIGDANGSAPRCGAVAPRLRRAVEMLLRWPAPERARVVTAVVAAADPVTFPDRDLDYVADLGRRFPGDMGVVVALLLNRVRLRADEAIWMPAGNLHAYLHGTGMEVLAASDNVLRGGLTTKAIDVDELLRVLRFEVQAEPARKAVVVRPGVLTWPAPAPEFALFRVEVGAASPIELAVEGPRIVFCAQGEVTVDDRDDDLGGSVVGLRAGSAAFGAARRSLRIGGGGVVFVATSGKLPQPP